MRELSIEEKAKAYDNALEVLHKYDGANIMFSQSLKEEMFPELAESEGERIRKALIFHYQGDGCICTNGYIINYKDIRAWLEKQGEQKPANWLQELEDKLANATPQQLAEWKEKYFKEEPAEWSKEDEYLLDETIKHLEALIRITKKQGSAYSDEIQYYQRDIDWLKSLKDRYTWKPSESQMKWLHDAIESTQYEPRKQALVSLYSDLMELKE